MILLYKDNKRFESLRGFDAYEILRIIIVILFVVK